MGLAIKITLHLPLTHYELPRKYSQKYLSNIPRKYPINPVKILQASQSLASPL